MPAFYRIINAIETKSSTGRVFVYLIANSEGDIYGVGSTHNLNVRISHHQLVEAYALKYKKPAHIWVVGSIIKENAKQAVKDLEKRLMGINCTTIKHMSADRKQPSWKHVETVLEDWRRAYRARYTHRPNSAKKVSQEAILAVFNQHPVDSPRIRKLLKYIASSYYANYNVFIFPMPLFYMGDTDGYKKDLNKIKHLVYTKNSPNAFASNNFKMTQKLEEEVLKLMQEKRDNG
jgi:predicted GIY-YIG superfamily endonuclease